MDDEQNIKTMIKEIGDVTLGSKNADIKQYFYEEVNFVAPDFKTKMQGREAALESYKDFRENAELQAYEQGDANVSLFGTTAVATYPFEIRYTINEQTSHESGRDIMVLIKQDQQWKIVWRSMVVLSSENQ